MGRISEGEAAVIDETNDSALKSWVETPHGSDFPIQNLPIGIFSVGDRRRRAGVAIGDFVLDLTGIADLLDEDWRETGPLAYGKIADRFLNPPFIAWGN